MKHRALLSFGAALGIAAAAFGTTAIESANTFGIFKLNDTTTTNLIISVPWVDCANESQSTLVSNVVKTTGLTAGDELVWKTGSDTYYGWKLVDGNWSPYEVVVKGEVTATPGAGEIRVSRGSALWLHRQNPANGPVYLFGQYTTAAVGETSVSAGVTTLVANPGTSDMTLFSFNTSKVPALAKGDKVFYGSKTYTYDGSAWTYKQPGSSVSIPGVGSFNQEETATVTAENTVTISAGTGFWFQPRGARTINW